MAADSYNDYSEFNPDPLVVVAIDESVRVHKGDVIRGMMHDSSDKDFIVSIGNLKISHNAPAWLRSTN